MKPPVFSYAGQERLDFLPQGLIIRTGSLQISCTLAPLQRQSAAIVELSFQHRA
jgi:hypothetical protein